MKHSIIGEWDDSIDGNVAAIFAVLLFPLMLMAGFSVDLARMASINQQIQIATDAAALAGARALQDASQEDEEIIQHTKSIFDANRLNSARGLSCAAPVITIDRDQDAVTVEAGCSIAKIFGGVFAESDFIQVANTTTSTIILPSIDIALMLDMSDSMNDGTRLTDLKTAAKTLTSSLVTSANGDRVRVALAPYGDAVNAGVYGNRAQGKNDLDDSDFDGDKVCVSRRRTYATEFTDDAPSPWNYVGDRVGRYCSEPMIVPLSNDVDALTSAIGALSADSNLTAGHLGLAWSWYLISPKWAEVWPTESKPLEYNAPNAIKAVVLMTDGLFNKHYDYAHWSGVFRSAQDVKILCENMLAEGILVYVVGLDVPEEVDVLGIPNWYAAYGAQVLLPHCAGDPARYFQPGSGDELVGVYESIAELLKIEAVVLTK